MPAKMARSAPRPPFGPSEVTVAVRNSLLSCRKAGKPRTSAPIRESSGESRLIHGVYSSDIVLPWEKAEDFNELLQGIRLDFMPNGTTEDDIVFEIAVLHWRKRRINRALQLEFLQSSVAAEIEKSGKRSVAGIRRSLKTQRIEEGRFAAAVVSLAEGISTLTDFANSKEKPW